MNDPGAMNRVGIVSTAHAFPEKEVSVACVFEEEGIASDPEGFGFDRVRVFEGERRSDLALVAARDCLKTAGCDPKDVDLIIDYSVLPQDYVVPSWCLSNLVQSELGATNAINLGFGGGGTTNILTALRFAIALIRSGEAENALLTAVDVAIPGNRVINPENPLTVLGDGAGAMLVGIGPHDCEIGGIELWSDGHLNDILCVAGGGLRHPARLDLYNLRIDSAAFSQADIPGNMTEVARRCAKQSGTEPGNFRTVVTPNISSGDRKRMDAIFPLGNPDPFADNRRHYGHVQGTDFVVNIAQLIDSTRQTTGFSAIACSHGWGFSYGAMALNLNPRTRD